MLVQVAYALLIGDLIMMVANQCRPYEIVPGSTDKAIDICMDAVIKRFTGERMVRYGEVKHLFRFVLTVFGKLKLDKTQKKKLVGIVGEIYVKFSPLGNNRLEEFLLSEGCEVVVLLNKCDLDPAEELYRIYTAAGFPTLRISAETGEGLEELIPLIAGKLSAFTGNSGVGKSSILNALDPAFQLKTGEISTALGRGRHTTRHVELFRLSCGAEIMDSPGFSSFETEELNLELKHRLPETFREFAPYLGACQFLNCSHTKEKGCAVREALEAGKLQPSRYQSYLRLFEELKPLREWQEKRK